MNWIWIGAVAALGLALWFLSRRVIVPPATVTLVYRGGRFLRELPPGLYWLIDFDRSLRLKSVPTTRTLLPSPETSVLSKDQFAFRLGFSAFGQVTDARAFHEGQPDISQLIPGYAFSGIQVQSYQPQLMSAALAEVSALTLDEFLSAPAAILPPLLEAVRNCCPGFEVQELLLTAVTMPPEIRKMFTEIERAKREGLASLERARSEQASLRALANAARSLKSNPELAHLRLMQTLETTKGAKTIVLGRVGLLDGDANIAGKE
jgi:regulator of protease activity HflC (stomatin/prohibitin superfamily)